MLLAAVMLIPLAVSLLMQEWAICGNYILGVGVALTLGGLMRLTRPSQRSMERKQAIATTGLVWLVGALVAAVPLYLSGHYPSFLDAVFEGMSGLTATGLTMVQDVDHLSMADSMWRFVMQFIGGQGVVVVALSLGLFSRTGSALYNSEGREEAVVPNIKNTSRFIWKFSSMAVLVGTIVLAVILIIIGVDPLRSLFHGLWITIGAYDTGGFAPTSLSIIYYHSWPFEIITMVIMMFGAVNFALFAQVHKGNWRLFFQDIEIKTLALWISGITVVFVAALSIGDFLTDYTGLIRRGIFTIISATTNTGYQLLSTNQITTLFSSGAVFLIAISMAIGGSSASTAGGIKALRVGIIFKGLAQRIKSMLLPRSAQITSSYNHIGRRQLNPELLSAALIVAALYVIAYVFGALIGIACGYDAIEATFESISAASNAGLSSGITTPDAPVILKVVYILQMWLGRLEFLTLLALFASLIASVAPRRRQKRRGVEKSRPKTMRRTLLVLLLVATSFCLVPKEAFAQTDYTDYISIEELNSAAAHLDHQQVSFVGEAVGDIINADNNHFWVTLNNGRASISVYIDADSAQTITNLGGYQKRGTTLEVVGEFNLACDQHDGQSDVHAISTMVVDPGEPIEHEPNMLVLLLGFAFVACGCGLAGLFGILNKRRR
jgi:trk system potassium uptake protein TrkH